MDDALIQALQAAKNPEDKAALIAEASLSTLSDETARLARQCVLFHWFDESIVAALQQAVPPDAESAQDAYKQITSLPFVEQLPSGVAYQDLTRQGLLKHYAHTQPELLKNAAQVAALAYSASTENNRHATEALFCSLISGDSASNQHLNTLLEQAMNQQDWQQMEGLFRLQEEAEQLPFVEPLPRTEQYWMLRSIVDRVQDRLDAALLDYNHALTINPQNALAYINRSIIHRQQKHRMEALADYNEALRLDPALVQTYTDIGSLENDSSDTEENDAEAPKPSEQESLDENDLAQVSHYPYVDNGILSPQPNRKRRNLIAFAVAVITVLAGSGATATLSGILAPPPSCPPDQTSCSGKCVNSLNDFHNCGRCGHACSSGQICTQGRCQCRSDLINCNGTCANPVNDSHNCGQCGKVCRAGETCINGTCCYACNGVCVDTSNDPSSCGRCGNACGPNQTCLNGTCKTQSCQCSLGQTCCSDVCVNTNNDSENCGRCGNTCPSGQTCVNGICCPSSLTNCSGICTNLSDNSNCGTCDHVCPSNSTCVNGTCQ